MSDLLEIDSYKFCDSTQRPWKFLEFISRSDEFWKQVYEEWSGFDLIPHRLYSWMFRRHRPFWTPDFFSRESRKTYDGLPKTFEAYRGVNECTRVIGGLSWTLDMEVARSFAHGHRGLYAKEPRVLMHTFHKNQVAMVIEERDESEIVSFGLPRKFDFIPMPRRTRHETG
jgi:hypothetical protein